MKVLVTGATGFLGKYVVKELVTEGYFVRAFGRNEAVGQSLVSDQVEFFKGDLSSKQAVEEACKGVEMVVHAGALSTVWGPWESFYQANVLGTQHVLEACRTNKIRRLVYVSSPSIYAAPKDQIDIKEEDAPAENHLNNYSSFLLTRMFQASSFVHVGSLVLGIPASFLVFSS